MRKTLKNTMAVLGIVAILGFNGINANAATATFAGRTVTYSKTRLSDTSARAITSTSGTDYVKARITAFYRSSGEETSKAVTGNGKVAAQATCTLNSYEYIKYITSYHEAGVYYQGADRFWHEYL